MRSLWTGSISFGLINIPVRLYSAVQDNTLDLDMLHGEDKQPIRYAKICKGEEKEIPYEEIVRGYKMPEGFYVVLTDEDFEKANAKKTKTIELLTFTEETEIDSMLFERPYYLEPVEGSERSYALLREALRKAKRVGVGRFVLRQREHIAVLSPRENVLVLNQLRFQDEVRPTDDLKIPGVKPQAQELKMAMTLIETLSGRFDPGEFKDTYTEELKRVIKAKAKGEKPKAVGKAPVITTDVTDLVQLLQKSLKQERQHDTGRVRSR